jgi:hypothetical protein
MDDTLVENAYSKENKPGVFSKIAFGFAILTFTLFTILLITVTMFPVVSFVNSTLPKLVSGLVVLSMILGLVFSIISLARREKIKYLKTIAAIVNIGLAVVVFGSMIFALFMDLRRISQ